MMSNSFAQDRHVLFNLKSSLCISIQSCLYFYTNSLLYFTLKIIRGKKYNASLHLATAQTLIYLEDKGSRNLSFIMFSFN